jgi:hypothetical protein
MDFYYILMEIKSLKESEKKILKNLAVEFSDDFLKQNNSNGRNQINLYGAHNCEILDFFEGELKSCLLEKGKNIKIRQNESVPYNIDVGFFLNAGYFKGINKY